MQTAQLLKRSLLYFWRTNLAVLSGVAIAVAVLAGALLVGDSVRASLRDLLLQRLGSTAYVIATPGFLRDKLAADLQQDEQFATSGLESTCPLIALKGTIKDEKSGRQAVDVQVYGVDERFWRFNGHTNDHPAPGNREVLLSEPLSNELGAKPADSLLLRVAKPSDVPAESLHGRKEDLGRTLRLTFKGALTAPDLGEFSLQPRQGAVRAVFVSLGSLQRDLGVEQKVNTIVVSQTDAEPSIVGRRAAILDDVLHAHASLEDLGIEVRPVDGKSDISLESETKLINDQIAAAARDTANKLSLRTIPVFSYLANRISSGERSIPYSLVTALDEESFGKLEEMGGGATSPHTPVAASPLILNEWAARDLGVRPGDPVSLEYYVWHEEGHLETNAAQFQLAAIVPISGLAADRDLVPRYEGITESQNLSDWDPPFPVDLSLVRKQDEDYWHQYRTTPKAFIRLAKGQELWGTRFGRLTSIRIVAPVESAPVSAQAFDKRLLAALSPAVAGIQIIPVRAVGLEASQGATDFGAYFLYFSFFLVISALLLTALFFKLGIEQRVREIGILQAIGFPPSLIRRLFLTEGTILAVLGSLAGLAGAVGYGQLMMLGLRTWWVGAVGTTMLSLHVSIVSMILGGAGGVVAALVWVVLTLRKVGRQSARSLLTGTVDGEWETGRSAEAGARRVRWLRLPSPRRFVTVSPGLPVTFIIAVALTIGSLLLLSAAAFHLLPEVAGFFGGGTLLLIAGLYFQATWLRRRKKAIRGTGWWAVSRLGFRNTTYRPARSVLCIALIASATFIIVAVDAFRRSADATLDSKSGTGGFPLLAESLLPLVPDPNLAAGRESLNIDWGGNSGRPANVHFSRFRVRDGDDASCLNLYQPGNPRIIAPTSDFVTSGRFTFQNSLAVSSDEKENPWLLLNRDFADGAIPVIGDANSLTYVMHLGLGGEMLLTESGEPVRLRVVGALSDSIFQSELMMSEKNFLRLFPEQEGYRFFLIDAPAGEASAVASRLEDRLSDFGFDVMPTGERLASFHRVENTYLSTFQMLGGLGLILGTVGLGAILLRNVFERRRELALLRAMGYKSWHFMLMVIAENALLLCCGLATGFVCALLAIAPVFFERGARLPNISLGVLLLAVLISGLGASLVATVAALRSPLLPALRAE